ncbi:uncharacterized protein PRD47_004048 [Ara ararauna]
MPASVELGLGFGKGVANDVMGREWAIVVLDSAIGPLPWFVVGVSPLLSGVVTWLAAEVVAMAAKGLPEEDEEYSASVTVCPCLRGAEVSCAACILVLPAIVNERLNSAVSAAGDMLEVEADGMELGTLGAAPCVRAFVDTVPDPMPVTAGVEEGAEGESAMDAWDVAANPTSVLPLVLLLCRVVVAAMKPSGEEEEEEWLIAAELGLRDREAAVPLNVSMLVAMELGVGVGKVGLIHTLPTDTLVELPSQAAVVDPASVLHSPPVIGSVEGFAKDEAGMKRVILVLGSAVRPLSVFVFGVLPLPGGAVTSLAAEVEAMAGKGLHGEDEVASTSVMVCPSVRGVDVSCAACILVLPAIVNERLNSAVSAAGDMLEVEADGMELGTLGAAPCVRAFVDTVPDPMPVTAGVEEGAEGESAMDAWDVAANPTSVLPLVLLLCRVVVAAMKPSGEEEEEEWLIAAELGLRDREAAVPLNVSMLVAMELGVGVGKVGLIHTLPTDTLVELPSQAAVVDPASVLHSPPVIGSVEGFAKDEAGMKRVILVLGSAVRPLSVFVFGVLPLPGGAVTSLAAEVEAMAGKGLHGGDEVASTSVMVCPSVRGVDVSCAACVSVLPVNVDERLATVVAAAGDMLEVEASGMELGALRAGPCVREFAVTVRDPMAVTAGVEEGAEDMSDVDWWDVVAKLSSVLLLVLLCCRVVVIAVRLSEEEKEWLVAAELGLKDRETAVPLDLSMPASVELGLGFGKGVANDVTGREWAIVVLDSAIGPLPWFVVGVSPLLSGVVTWLAAEVVAMAAKGLPEEDEEYSASVTVCPCLRGAEVSCAACILVLPAIVNERLNSAVSAAGDMLEVEADGMELGTLGAAPCVRAFVDTVPDPMPVTAGVEEGAEGESAMDAWDVAANPTSVLPLVLLLCRVVVAAMKPSGEEEEEEWLIAAELGLRDREAAVPLNVSMLVAMELGVGVGKVGLIHTLPTDTLVELPSQAAVVDPASVLHSPPVIGSVEGFAKDEAGMKRVILVLGSAVRPLSVFVFGVLPLPGGAVTSLAAEVEAMAGKGLHGEDEVASTSVMVCPSVRGVDVSCAACILVLPAIVNERLNSAVSAAGDMLEVEADGMELGTLGAAPCVRAFVDTVPDPMPVTAGVEEGAEGESAMDAWDVAANPTSVLPLVLLLCRVVVAAMKPSGEEEEEEWLIAAELGLRDREAAVPLNVSMLVAMELGVGVGKVGLIHTLPTDTLVELPSQAAVVDPASVLHSPPVIGSVEGFAKDEAGMKRVILVLGSAVRPLSVFVFGVLPLPGGAVTSLAAEVEAMAGKGLHGGDEVASTSVMVCPSVRGVDVSCAACVSVLPVNVDERLATVVAAAGDMLEVEASGMELGALRAGPCVREFAVTVRDPMAVTAGVEEGAEDMSDVDWWDVVAKLSSVLLLVLLCCRVVVIAVRLSEEEKEWLVAAELGLKDRETAVPLDLSMPASVELGLGFGKGVANDVTGREWAIVVLDSAIGPLPWFVVGVSPLLSGVVTWLAAEVVAMAAKGLPEEDEEYSASVTVCPCLRGAEVSCAACILVLPAIVNERLNSAVSAAGDMLEVEADGMELGTLGAAPCVRAFVDTVPDPMPVTAGVEEGAEGESAMDAWDVAANPTSVLPLVLLLCRVVVAAMKPSGEEEEEEWLIAAELGLRDREAAVPLNVSMLVAMELGVGVGKVGLIHTLPTDTLVELPSQAAVVDPASVLHSPPVIGSVEGFAKDEAGMKRVILVLGSAVRPLSVFVFGVLPLPGGAVTSLAAEVEAMAGKGLHGEDEVASTSVMVCPSVRGVDVSCAACILVLPAIVNERLNSAVSAAGDMLEVEADGMELGTLGAAPCVRAFVDTVPDPMPVTAGVEEGAEDTSSRDGWGVVAKPASVFLLVLLFCGVGAAAVKPTVKDEERLNAAELGLREREAAVSLAVSMLVAMELGVGVGKVGLIASLLADTSSELPSQVDVMSAVSVLASPSIFSDMEGVTSNVEGSERFMSVL